MSKLIFILDNYLSYIDDLFLINNQFFLLPDPTILLNIYLQPKKLIFKG